VGLLIPCVRAVRRVANREFVERTSVSEREDVALVDDADFVSAVVPLNWVAAALALPLLDIRSNLGGGEDAGLIAGDGNALAARELVNWVALGRSV